MPFYEYQCSECGHQLEALQKLGDAPLRKCPACGRAKLARIVSRVAFRLKGSGWYETDFKADGENKRNLVADESGGDSAGPSAEPAAPATETAKPADKPADQPAPAKVATAKKKAAASKTAKPRATARAVAARPRTVKKSVARAKRR